MNIYMNNNSVPIFHQLSQRTFFHDLIKAHVYEHGKKVLHYALFVFILLSTYITFKLFNIRVLFRMYKRPCPFAYQL